MILKCILIAGTSVVFCAGASSAQVGVKISIKFILDANGNRPATGNLNTDARIVSEVDQGTQILREVITEFGLNRVELVDVAGISQWYSVAATTANRDAIRNAAIANPASYLWRTDSLNIYINGGTGSAVSDFPPNNNIILMNQLCTNTPSCILHETSHSLNLLHTHEANDGCADTLPDNSSWTKDQLSQANFGQPFANLNATQQDQVNLTYNNIMSYHTDEAQRRISPCQMDRMSTQGYSDRNRLYVRIPVYVNGAFAGAHNGSFANPYQTLQAALNAGGLADRAIVLQQGNYTTTQPEINVPNLQLLTRSGTSAVSRTFASAVTYAAEQRGVSRAAGSDLASTQGAKSYNLPVNFDNSQNASLRALMKAVQTDDTSARKITREAEDAARNARTEQEKAAILAAAEARKKQLEASAVSRLLESEQVASGDERLAVRFELAQRYRDSRNWDLALKYYRLVADTTDQQGLKA